MTLETVESILWRQARNLNSHDDITRRTSMDAILEAVRAYAERQCTLAVTRAPRRPVVREATRWDDPTLAYAGLPFSKPMHWEAS